MRFFRRIGGGGREVGGGDAETVAHNLLLVFWRHSVNSILTCLIDEISHYILYEELPRRVGDGGLSGRL